MKDFQPLPFQFREIKNKLTSIQKKVLSRHQLSQVMMYALELLLQNPHYIAVDIANEAGLTRGAVTQLLDKLESMGMISRKPHPSSRRSLQIVVTEQGKSLTERILQEYDAEISRLFAGFSDEEAERLSALLNKLPL